MRASRVIALGLTLAICAAAPLSGDAVKQPGETLPGFKAQGVYDGQGIENLSLFNGDPQLAVPLGPEYPTGPGTSFRLTAYYSTRFWHMYEVVCDESAQCAAGNVSRAHVRGLPTIGVGWTLELGSIDPLPSGANPSVQARYLSPDGGIHEFNEPVPGSPVYTPDSSNVRIEKRAEGGYVVRQTDGTSLWLTHRYTRPPSRNEYDFSDVDHVPMYPRTDRWGLKEIRDRFDNTLLTVTWAAEYPAPNAWKVASIELQNPVRTIQFSWTTYQLPPPAQPWDVLSSIEFPVLGSPETPLTTTFGYASSGLFKRTGFDKGWIEDCQGLSPTTAELPFLTSITQSTNVYSFAYSLGATTGSGLLESFRLPTGTLVEYQYKTATEGRPCIRGTSCDSLDEGNLPLEEPSADPGCDAWTRISSFIDNSPAVSLRTETDPTTGQVAVTSYARKQFSELDPDFPNNLYRDPERTVRRVIVKRPSGNVTDLATRHLFRVTGGGSGPGLEVERRSYSGALATGEAGSVLRSVVQCYGDKNGVGVYETACAAFANDGKISPFTFAFNDPRVTDEVTWYGPNPLGGNVCNATTAATVACKAIQRTEWKPDAREFRKETISAPTSGPSSILLQSGQTGRSTTTEWHAEIADDSWQPKLYTSRTVEDLYSIACPFPPCSVTTSFDFNDVTGALESSTVTEGSLSRSTAFTYTNGDPTTETISGSVPSDTYETKRTFQSGLVKTSSRTFTPDSGWKQFDVTRDTALGLVTTSRDPNSLATSYAWDPLARLTGIDPPGTEESPTMICYGAWSATPDATKGAWALVRKGSATTCDTPISTPAEGSETVEAYVYDGLGRLSREIRLLPNTLTGSETSNYLAVRTTERNGIGLVTAVSEWVPCGTGSDPSTCYTATTTDSFNTRYSVFDVFGRPQKVVLPDGTEITKRYDDWQTTFFSDNRLYSTDTREDTWISNVTAPAKRSYEFVRKDIFGRPIIASEPVSLAAGASETAGPLTYYRHDIHDQVAEVKQERTPTGGEPYTQTRTFTRNALGLLTSVTQPESGTTTYSSFNALGLPKTKINGGVTTETTYDALGRVLKVSAGSTDVIENKYDEATDADGNNLGSSLGKLTTSTNWNRYPSGVPTPGTGAWDDFYPGGSIRDVFTYGGIGGRLSKKRTTLSNGTVSAIGSWTYNNLGLVENEAHPRIDPNYSPLVVTTKYTAGLPTKVGVGSQLVASSVTYSPSGGLTSYTSGNNFTTTITSDDHGMPRPKSIKTDDTNPNTGPVFDTGAFAYDGAGNILSMGTDLFTYDAASRLLSATYGTPQDYIYDGWGNLTSKADTAIGVNSATNRLTAATYDSRGNVEALGSERYRYDSLGRQVRNSNSTDGRYLSYLLDAANERLTKSSPPTPSGPPALRRETARIISQTLGLSPLVTPQSSFSDVSLTDPDRGWIERFKATGITAGCGTPTVPAFCPESSLTRLETAVFLAKARAMLYEETIPDSGFVGTQPYVCTTGTGGLSVFSDVPYSWPHCKFVHYLAAKGVVAGCGGGAFCPMVTVNHWQMEVFVSKIKADFRYVPPGATYTFRGPSGSVLTEFQDSSSFRSGGYVSKDFVYLGNRLVGTKEASSGWLFHATDHLGSVRLTMNGSVLTSRKYWPWGEETIDPGPAALGFAGMERDTETEYTRPRYYDHARSIETGYGRFLSPDMLSGKVEDPLSWNRYTYARNNPLKYVDPDGKAVRGFRVIIDGPNRVPNAPKVDFHDTSELGPIQTSTGGFFRLNVEMAVTEDDDVSNCTPFRIAHLFEPVVETRRGRKENPDRQSLQADGKSLFIWDAPGLSANPRVAIGDRKNDALYIVGAKDKSGNIVGGIYYRVSVAFKNGALDLANTKVYRLTASEFEALKKELKK